MLEKYTDRRELHVLAKILLSADQQNYINHLEDEISDKKCFHSCKSKIKMRVNSASLSKLPPFAVI